MAIEPRQSGYPFGLLVTGEAESWLDALDCVVGRQWIQPYKVRNDRELLDVVEAGKVDAAVLDDGPSHEVPVMHMLRLIRKINHRFPVVVVTSRTDRRVLEDALRLAAFSVMTKPLGFEALLRQVQRIMTRMNRVLDQQARDN